MTRSGKDGGGDDWHSIWMNSCCKSHSSIVYLHQKTATKSFSFKILSSCLAVTSSMVGSVFGRGSFSFLPPAAAERRSRDTHGYHHLDITHRTASSNNLLTINILLLAPLHGFSNPGSVRTLISWCFAIWSSTWPNNYPPFYVSSKVMRI